MLTEPTFFDGSLEHLAAVRRRGRLPLLRKDFIVSEYQLLEARAAGADAVLLIVAALDAGGAARAARARGARSGWTRSSKCTTPSELALALDAGARIIGVNNRNLRTLDVDVARVGRADRADAARRHRRQRERAEDARPTSMRLRRSATARS